MHVHTKSKLPAAEFHSLGAFMCVCLRIYACKYVIIHTISKLPAAEFHSRGAFMCIFAYKYVNIHTISRLFAVGT